MISPGEQRSISWRREIGKEGGGKEGDWEEQEEQEVEEGGEEEGGGKGGGEERRRLVGKEGGGKEERGEQAVAPHSNIRECFSKRRGERRGLAPGSSSNSSDDDMAFGAALGQLFHSLLSPAPHDTASPKGQKFGPE